MFIMGIVVSRICKERNKLFSVSRLLLNPKMIAVDEVFTNHERRHNLVGVLRRNQSFSIG